MDVLNTIETTDESGRKVMTFTTPPRCKTWDGATGRVMYAKSDGWLGVALDGEVTVSGRSRVDEYMLAHVTIDPAIGA